VAIFRLKWSKGGRHIRYTKDPKLAGLHLVDAVLFVVCECRADVPRLGIAIQIAQMNRIELRRSSPELKRAFRLLWSKDNFHVRNIELGNPEHLGGLC
jgi:hypothetical protein